MAWHWLDLAIIGIIALSVITGLFRGFVKELIALGVWILAIWLAFHYSTLLAPKLQVYIQEERIRNVVAFVGILLATLIIGAIFNGLLSFILKRSGLSGTDRILGMGFGFVRGVFIIALLILVTKLTSLPYQQYTQESQLYAKFDPLVSWLSSFTPDLIRKVKSFDTTGNLIDITPAG